MPQRLPTFLLPIQPPWGGAQVVRMTTHLPASSSQITPVHLDKGHRWHWKALAGEHLGTRLISQAPLSTGSHSVPPRAPLKTSWRGPGLLPISSRRPPRAVEAYPHAWPAALLDSAITAGSLETREVMLWSSPRAPRPQTVVPSSSKRQPPWPNGQQPWSRLRPRTWVMG